MSSVSSRSTSRGLRAQKNLENTALKEYDLPGDKKRMTLRPSSKSSSKRERTSSRGQLTEKETDNSSKLSMDGLSVMKPKKIGRGKRTAVGQNNELMHVLSSIKKAVKIPSVVPGTASKKVTSKKRKTSRSKSKERKSSANAIERPSTKQGIIFGKKRSQPGNTNISPPLQPTKTLTVPCGPNLHTASITDTLMHAPSKTFGHGQITLKKSKHPALISSGKDTVGNIANGSLSMLEPLLQGINPSDLKILNQLLAQVQSLGTVTTAGNSTLRQGANSVSRSRQQNNATSLLSTTNGNRSLSRNSRGSGSSVKSTQKSRLGNKSATGRRPSSPHDAINNATTYYAEGRKKLQGRTRRKAKDTKQSELMGVSGTQAESAKKIKKVWREIHARREKRLEEESSNKASDTNKVGFSSPRSSSPDQDDPSSRNQRGSLLVVANKASKPKKYSINKEKIARQTEKDESIEEPICMKNDSIETDKDKPPSSSAREQSRKLSFYYRNQPVTKQARRRGYSTNSY